MTKDEKNSALLTVVGAITIIPVMAVFHGWVLCVLWGWFLVALGAPAISIAHAIGLSLIGKLMLSHRSSKRDDETLAHVLAVGMLGALMALGIGWIAKGFI